MRNSNKGYQDYYVYELAYPKSMGSAVFYIGKGRARRIKDHEPEARRGHQCQRCDIIRFIWLAGEQVVKRKIATELSEREALRLEMEAINTSTDALINSHRNHTYKAFTSEWRERRSLEAKQKWAEVKTQSWWKKQHP